jgi:hypothetical protein
MSQLSYSAFPFVLHPICSAADMSFPVMLAGVRVVPKEDWCRGCDNGEWKMVSTVASTGKKKQPFCKQCWQSYMPQLTAEERGEAPVALAPTAAAEAPYTCCKNKSCALLWRKARHESGYCSWTCAQSNGSVQEESYAVCRNTACALRWRKARHESGYCSWTCAQTNGWAQQSVQLPPPPALEEVQMTADERARVPPPALEGSQMRTDEPDMSDDSNKSREDDGGSRFDSGSEQEGKEREAMIEACLDMKALCIAETADSSYCLLKAANKFLGGYIAKHKDIQPIKANGAKGRQGLGYDDSSSKRQRFFQEPTKMEFVYGYTMKPAPAFDMDQLD